LLTSLLARPARWPARVAVRMWRAAAHALPSAVAPPPPWRGAAEVWELRRDHAIFEGGGETSKEGRDGDQGSGRDAGAAQRRRQAAERDTEGAAGHAGEAAGGGFGASLRAGLTTAEAAARLSALPAGSVVVLDGFAVLQLAAAVKEAEREGGWLAGLTLVAMVHYPFSLEVDATDETRSLCRAQEAAVLLRCDGIAAASGVTRDALLSEHPTLAHRLVSIVRPPHRFEAVAAPLPPRPKQRRPPRRDDGPQAGGLVVLLVVANLIPRKVN